MGERLKVALFTRPQHLLCTEMLFVVAHGVCETVCSEQESKEEEKTVSIVQKCK